MGEEYKDEKIHVGTYQDAAIFAFAAVSVELSNQ